MLDRVTITGADESIKPTDLAPLSKKYPFVEWGILFSGRKQGAYRFPSPGWLGLLRTVKKSNPNMKLSAHLCGKWVREFVQSGHEGWRERYPDLWPLFERIQLNFHGNWHKISREFLDLLKTIDKQIIFQVDGVNDLAWAQCQNLCDAVPFFDASHGAGVMPEEWPKPFTGVYNGYSGGLGPGNLPIEIPKIQKIVGDARFWIDMETKVRSYDDSKFDLEKVQVCLDEAAPFVQ